MTGKPGVLQFMECKESDMSYIPFSQILSYIILQQNQADSFERWLIIGLGHVIYKMSLEHLAFPENESSKKLHSK